MGAELFAGAGVLGQRIARLDWASTSLGPIDSWPAVLRNAVSLILPSETAFLILWGEDGVMIYNEAFSVISGERDDMLGAKVREGSPSSAEFHDEVLRTCLAGKNLSFRDREVVLHRSGRPENVMLDLSYSPIRDEEGVPVGVLATVIETTDTQMALAALSQSAAKLSFLDELSHALLELRGAGEILATITRMTAEHLGATNCAYADMDEDEDGFTILGDWHAPGTQSIAGHYSLADFGRRAVRDLSAGEPLILNDIPAELPPEEARTFQDIGLSATICMPLVKHGKLTALMAVHHNVPHEWTDYELSIIREVTDRSWAHIQRMGAEEDVRESEARLRLATDAAEIGTWDFDPRSGLLRWDARCKGLFGLPADAEVSYEGSFLPGLHPEDRERTHRAVQNALTPGGSPDYEMEYRTIGLQDGVVRWIAAKGSAIFHDGEAVRFIGTVLDITARKEAERRFQIVSSTGAMAAELRDVDDIVQKITDAGVELTGAQFGAFFYNKTDERGERYMLYALSGVPRDEFSKFPMPRITEVFAPTFAGTGVIRSEDIRSDPRYGRNKPHSGMPRGHLPVRSYLAVPVASRSGEVFGALLFGHEQAGIFQEEHETLMIGLAGQAATAIENSRLIEELQALNATLEQRVTEVVAERVRTEEQLRQAQKMEAIGQLTGGIAHDFNNMLAVVIGALNLMERRLKRGDTNVQTYVDAASEGANRAAALTRRLLAFSRQQPLDPSPLDPNKLVVSMTELLMRTLGEQIRIETVLAAGLWRCFVDQIQLESALLNLAVNARDAMPDGGRLTIDTANTTVDDILARSFAIPEGQYVMIAVTDTGEGMSEEVMHQAFDPFFTTKSVGKGSGLGLSQVFGFVRQSGGHVKLYSEPGVGTTVKLYLPRYRGPETEIGEDHETKTMPVGSDSEVVLVVEDEERVRTYSIEALKELGYSVISAAGPLEALRIIDSGQAPDLLFTDIVMPDMNGRQLADAARERLPGIKVLYTTGYTRNAIVHNGTLDVGTMVLQKPFTIDQLATKVRQVIDS